MHRLRQALPYLREFGWDPVVFAVDPRHVEGARDELLLETVPTDVKVRRVGALPVGLTRLAGLGNLGFRSWFQLRAAVADHLAREGADLVFFTTTVFASIAHGPYWKRRFGTPFVVDLQDPWRNDYYLGLPKRERPRKFWFDHWQKSRLEAATMPQADGVIAVSQAYIDTVQQRYSGLEGASCATLQFGVEPRDFDMARGPRVKNPAFSKVPGVLDLVFAGVAPTSMERSIRALLLGAREVSSQQGPALRLHFLGTDYASAARARSRVMPLAREYGVETLVNEIVTRLPYFEALRAVSDADIILLLGTDDLGYSASKFAQTLAAGRPTFAVFHRASHIIGALRQLGVEDHVGWSDGESPEAIAPRVAESLRRLIGELPERRPPGPEAIVAHHARERTRQLAELMDQAALRRAPPPDAHCSAGPG
jgi:glycosyltransferase involved in cell wall biosynthesis